MPDPDAGDIFICIFIIIAVVALNAFLTASETAIASVNRAKLRAELESGGKKAAAVDKLLSRADRFSVAVKTCIALLSLWAAAISAQTFSGALAARLVRSAGMPAGAAGGLSALIVILLPAYFTLVPGVFVPKQIAAQRPDKTAFATARLMSVLDILLRPLVSFITASVNFIVKLLGFRSDFAADEVTEEDVLSMVDAGEETGVIEESEKDMIYNVVEFGDRTVSEVMTHRTEVVAISDDTSIPRAAAIAINEGCTRIPVYDSSDDIDSVVGVLYVKDLLKYVGDADSSSIPISSIMHEPQFVADTQKCGDVFRLMSKRHLHMAIVTDEYGGTAGIITMEDLLESIVGSIQDEYDNESDDIEKIDDNTFTVDGTTDISEIEKLLGVDMPEGDYDTVAGMVTMLLGRIPEEGEHPSVEVAGYVFTVDESDCRHVDSVVITHKKRPPEPSK